MRRAFRNLDPHAVLAVGAGVEVACEMARTHTGSPAWVFAGASVGTAALVLAWLRQDRLQLVPLAAIAVTFHLLVIWSHEVLGSVGDLDTNAVWPVYGNEFLAGQFPETEYPAGAVVLFALEAWLGGDSADTPNRLLMVPFQLACVLAVWGLRTPSSRWLAAVLAIWPTSIFYWEYRFDLIPAALLVVGLLLAYRGRWGWSGVALALGTWIKWTPALALVVLAAWLLASRRRRECLLLAGSFVLTFIVANLPFVVWNAHNTLAPYRSQSGRGITNESVWYFPLTLLGLTGPEGPEWAPTGAPHGADQIAAALQLALLAGLVVLAVRNSGRLRPALALAALAPVVFLLTNKIFSAQFLVVVGTGLAFAAALVTRGRREQLVSGLLLMIAMLANAFVYPYDFPSGGLSWRPASALMFASAFVLTSLLIHRAARFIPEPEVAAAASATPPGEPSLRWVGPATLGASILVFAAATYAGVVVPYRLTESLALGAWSRTIAEGAAFHLGASDVHLNRPLFLVLQGLGWQLLGGHVWLGRLLSVAFGVALVGALWLLVNVLVRDRPTQTLVRAFAIAAVLGSSLIAGLVAAGVADVPVAAASAATAVLLWSPRRVPARLYLVTITAAATMLAKPTGFLAVVGLALATIVLLERTRAVEGLVGLTLATAAILVYSWFEAHRLGESTWAFATSGDGDYRAAATTWLDATLRAEWLGAGARLLLLFGLVYGTARAARVETRTALRIAGPAAIGCSLVGPVVADGDVPYPFDRIGPGAVTYVLLAAALLLAPFGAVSDRIDGRVYRALLLWVTPAAVVWVAAGASEPRLLSVAWPAIALLVGAGLAVATLALAQRAPSAALLPATGMALLVLGNLVAIDGLGRDGWRHVLEDGSDDDFAYGPLGSTVHVARANTEPGDLIASNDARIGFFFPGRVRVVDGDACSEADGADYLSISLDDTSDVALRWLQCRRPRMHLVAQREGAYAGFLVGRAAEPRPDPSACGITGYPGQMFDAVFADGVGYAEARALAQRARGAGFVQARIERTGCSTFRVLNTGLPATPAGQADFRHEAESVGLHVSFAPAVRHPEVPLDIPPLED